MSVVITLALKYWREVTLAVVVLALVAACHARDVALTERGVAQERWRKADSTLKVLAVEKRKIDSVFVHDTLRFTQTRDSLVTLTNTVTQWKHDTVAVVQYVERTTDAINACTALLSSCNARATNLEEQLAQERSKLAAAPALPKPARHCGLGAAGGYGLVWSTGIRSGPSLTVGLTCRL